MKSQQAQAAALIRKELKEAFPATKFSVTSESFSMGDSVSIGWTDGPTTEQVDKIVLKYQYGHFNSMEDIYEYTNSREDIPQSKYVQTGRTISPEQMQKAKGEIATEYGIACEWDEQEWYDVFHQWSSCVLHRHFAKLAL